MEFIFLEKNKTKTNGMKNISNKYTCQLISSSESKRHTSSFEDTKEKKYKKKAAMMATLKLNRLLVRNWQYYTNKQSKNNIVYGLKTKVAFLKPLARIGLKCTSWTFEVAKTKYITHRNEQVKTKSQRKSFYSYKKKLCCCYLFFFFLHYQI